MISEIQELEASVCLCGERKQEDQQVCWACFKGTNGKIALKDFNGTFEQWIAEVEK